MAKKKTGRPKRVFTKAEMEQIDQMALNNCHIDTIGLALGIPKQTLVQSLSTYISQKRAQGRTELRKAQRDMVSKNAAMAIFLGKNELNQRDKWDVEHSGTVNLAQALHKAKAGKDGV